MSEAHWMGASSVHGDADIEWCITCDKKAELMDCEQCANACCHNCSECTDTGIICRYCYEGDDEIDLTKSKCCGSKLRVYQPYGQSFATIYCPKCESPWMVHCRDANGADIHALLEWFEGEDE